MRATIITDASFCSKTHAAGWAAWVKSDNASRSQMWSGPLKVQPANSMEAELFAIANALHAACSSEMIARGDEVLMQSDCAMALGLILARVRGATLAPHQNSAEINIPKRQRAFNERVGAALGVIAALALAGDLKIKVRHVRGHTAGDGRQWVNRQCDYAAKRAMKILRAERKTQGPVQPIIHY